ncbi:thiosulfate/3-mercaptopyruvate sulfurtransferase [Rhodothalassium salexigens DSM 2132]|uniref:3-mercaptopyruvate sulfurtransferase n=1 Tax=Rhodothalassium salexigens DSM 2132 TaxID=1188247 RepID=A0A4R2PD64_RHOSA|nr:3-mercaptopyruvate sulfurtransferase [Rhodothalassium salexigens]MBB4212153.1 thiosulfate/3-mercaptopyruvate sulfurtransferase [Rhodothalassium salexigens DSM 2132]TCP33027.1 thiosulfate/3-mercaptopyruvate sulfurtransferase [Rhodothalassium salexigens DSM 2132]
MADSQSMPRQQSGETGSLVSAAWLADHMTAPDIRIVDASWHFPDSGRKAHAEYEEAHIPGAVFFDIDEIKDTAGDLPHMLPPAEKFSSRVREMGLGDGNRLVIYDTGGVHPAARVWWMFRVFGCRDVVVLDGGLAGWRAQDGRIDDIPPIPRRRHFSPRYQATLVRDADQVAQALDKGTAQVVDARGGPRFSGADPDPRPGIRSGHIPGSLNVPFASLFNDDGTYKDPDGLRAAFEAGGVDLSRPVITTCGSGITACTLALALDILGKKDVAVYDGSWADWGADRGDQSRPIATGAPA